MPRRDGTGPMGQGPLSGRRTGACDGQGKGQGAGGMGKGMRRGSGQGMGKGNRGALSTQGSETLAKEELLQEKKMLQQRLEMINKDLEKV
nr:DUF5320 domain-containing protein [uncultured Anaeromusa sp.]